MKKRDRWEIDTIDLTTKKPVEEKEEQSGVKTFVKALEESTDNSWRDLLDRGFIRHLLSTILLR